MNERTVRGPVTGASTLLTIFTILCIAVFSALTVATAGSSERISQAYADSITEYYAADTAAEEIFAEIRSAVGRTGDIRNVEKELAGRDVEIKSVENGWCFEYSCPQNEKSELRVSLLFDSADGTFRVMSWKTVNTSEWEADDSIEVWNGEVDK